MRIRRTHEIHLASRPSKESARVPFEPDTPGHSGCDGDRKTYVCRHPYQDADCRDQAAGGDNNSPRYFCCRLTASHEPIFGLRSVNE